MKRTSKALARIGIGAVTTAAILATPLAIGTASAALPADTLTQTATTDGTVTTPTNLAGGSTYTGEGATQVTYTPGVTGSGAQTITFTTTSATAYIPTTQTDAKVSVNAGHTVATCTTTAADEVCTVSVGDIAAEAANLNVQDTAGDTASPNVTATVPFNGLHIANCSQTGIDDGTNCITQAAINTSSPQVVNYTEAGHGAGGHNINATLPALDATHHAQFAAGGSGVTITNADNTAATCTTAADGTCSFPVIDSVTENILLTVTIPAASAAPYPTASAAETIQFQAAAVAPAELDLDASKVIAPSTQTAASGAAGAEPGDVIQNTYTLRGSQVPASGTCSPAAPNTTTCPGTPLSNTSVSLKVSDGFFTPNCAFPASSVSSTVVGTNASPGNNNYGSCSFATAPAAGGVTGNLTNSGTTATFKTDANGRFIVSLGIGKDAGFDDDGTVVAAVSDGTIVPQLEGDNNSPTSSACATATGTAINPQVGGSGVITPTSSNGGCDVNTVWTTNEAPLNGGTATYVVVPPIKNPNNTFIGSENNYAATDTGTINVPDVDRVVFVVHMTDQFGNLTSNVGAPAANSATITKTGPGNLLVCGTFTSTDACSGTGTSPTGTTQPDGTVTQTVVSTGSYTNNTSTVQKRYEADASDPGVVLPVNNSCEPQSSCTGTEGTPGVNDGTQTDTLTWHPETSTFVAFTAATSTTPAFAQFTSGTAATASTDTLTFNFYNQLAQPVITFSVKPGHKVPTGTGVTATAKVLDQFKNPIVDQLVQFVRTGSNESSCVPIQNGGDSTTTPVTTNAAGVAGYTFSCNAAGTSTVSIVVTGPGDTQLAQGKEAVKFTGQSLHLAKEKPTLKVHAKGHHVTLKIATHPKVHGKTVHFYKLVHGLRHLIGAAKTSKSGHATLHVKLHHGKFHFDAKVQGLKSTKYNSKYSKTKTLKV